VLRKQGIQISADTVAEFVADDEDVCLDVQAIGAKPVLGRSFGIREEAQLPIR
jgi:hypothetical protein